MVLLLPHGFEGQGPEHSSARLERFLQLCGRGNMIVGNFTTPAQIFHALRRQMKRDFRKPLVVMSPKSLLRHPMAVSNLVEFTSGGFQEVLDDPESITEKGRDGVKRVLLCSGKVYYDLLNEKTARKATDTAILRVEQLYPWPAAKIVQILKSYKNAKDVVWVQEEPRNMGAWTHVFNNWMGGYGDLAKDVGGRGIRYVGRDIGAAPAVGSAKLHEKEQKALVEQAFSS
jgi:2-oxoglutarate dehydrogenase E1 component